MVRLIIIALLFYLFYQAIKKLLPPEQEGKKIPRKPPSDKTATPMFKDPQCQTYVPEPDAIKAHIGGETHYFCSQKCLEEFKKSRES